MKKSAILILASSSNFDSNIQIGCWTLIIAIGIGIPIEYVAFEVYSISTPIPMANPSFHVIVIIRIAGKTTVVERPLTVIIFVSNQPF
jgi:hypothetical protein